MSTTQARRKHWPLAAEARYLGPHEGTAPIDVTVVLRRRGDHPTPAAWPHPATTRREDFGARWGAAPADAETVRSFAQSHGLTETGCELHRRVLHLRGTPQQLEQAFGVELGRYQFPDGGAEMVGCRHPLVLPASLSSTVIAVLGLDQRPVARPHFRRPSAKPSVTYTPLQVGQAYAFPAGTDGTGQTVAVIELGGGFTQADFTQYIQSLGISKVPTVNVVSVAGGSSQTGSDADGEVMLDVEVIGALAPGATIAAYFAPNTDQGFYEAISQAAHDATNHPSVISISWGGPEDSWSAASLAAMQSALQDAVTLGLSVTVAAGDSGYTDGASDGQPHVDYPASSPYALACGGTHLVASGGTISSETVWNELSSNEGATGGGVSASFALPSWQQSSKVPKGTNNFVGRGVPDVAGDADPTTGYQVRVDGQDEVIGGTSAVAPLWAALIARFNQQLGQNLGDPHAALYAIGESAFHDITSGSNGKFKAGKGWDACTGLGTPNGQALLTALAGLKTSS
ncbi:protease pro-enzyme activation domain-containing protein [Dyella sp. C9]|uniref:S53 family peptidase n=1 Tax=Dyella sp. C9 TaxID=2202154 RepID=UPI000DEF1F8B|nr:S53 family peptidase [Dyella sp. C9]